MAGTTRRQTARGFWTLALTAMIGGCATVGPDYARPPVDVPPAYRGAEAAAPAPAEPGLADQAWQALYADEALRDLVAAALRDSYDLAVAAARILQAEAQFGITHSQALPTVDAQATAQGQRTSVGTSDGEARTGGVAQLGAALSWEPDFWGKYRRADEAARAQIRATEWGRRAIVTSLIGRVASGYFALRALDLELEIAERTLESRQESLRLTQVRESGGVTSLVDVRQAEQLVLGATTQIIDLRRLIVQQENYLSVLVGRNPGGIARGQSLTDQPLPPAIPAGLPSTLLERRPDIQLAEQEMVAANAGIGVARADYFPQIRLTGAGGVASTALASLFSGPAAAWSAAAAVAQPIFDGGRIRSQVALAEGRRQEAEAVYQQTIQQAFREVSDALVGHQRSREYRDAQERLVVAAQDARRLADIRYQGGVASYLEVLDSDTRLFIAENDLVRAQLAELTSVVELYRALGGGWQP
jgi:outer membrane protein, multidrug efflux system